MTAATITPAAVVDVLDLAFAADVTVLGRPRIVGRRIEVTVRDSSDLEKLAWENRGWVIDSDRIDSTLAGVPVRWEIAR